MDIDLEFLESKQGVTLLDINRLTERVGWGDQYYETESKWQYTLNASTHIAYLKKSDRLIAFGRILEDGQMCMFYDICVDPDHQGTGIGTKLMEYLIDKIKDKHYVSVGLLVWEGNQTAAKFYQKFGFQNVVAMELKKYMKHV